MPFVLIFEVIYVHIMPNSNSEAFMRFLNITSRYMYWDCA